MDNKIRDLQAQLHALYEEKAVQKLSERSCAMILLRLMQSGALQLAFTMDGKEYVTFQHLESEIKQETYKNGGRLAVVELQPLLNIDLGVIEERILNIIRGGDFFRVQGDLMSREYLESLADEIKSMLLEHGFLTYIDLLNRFNLPSDFFTQKFLVNYSGRIDAIMEDNTLFTTSFLSKTTCQIRGAFLAITEPTMISTIQSTFSIVPKTFLKIIEQLQKSGELPGEFKGNGINSIYTPNIYQIARFKYIKDFLSRNEHIEISILSQLGISNYDRYFVENNLSGYTCLKNCYVTTTLLDSLNGAIDDIINESSWMDCTSLCTFSLSFDDLNILISLANAVKHIDKKEPEIVILKETFISSMKFIKICLKKYEIFAKEKALKSAASPTTISVSYIEPHTNSKEAATTTTNNNNNNNNSNKKGKQQAQQQKGNEKKNSNNNNTSNKANNNEGEKDLSKIFMQLCYRDTPLVDIIDEKRANLFFSALIQFAKSTITSIDTSAMESVKQQTTTINKKDKLKEFQKRIDILYLNILMFDKGNQTVQDKNLNSSLSTHLLSSLGDDLLNAIVENQALLDLNQHILIVDAPSRKIALNQLSKEFAASFNDLEAAKKNSMSAFLSSLKKLSEKHDLYLRTMDAKSQRTLQLNHKNTLLSQLSTCTDPIIGFFLIVSIYHMKYLNLIIFVDHKNVNHLKLLLDNIKEKMEADETVLKEQNISYKSLVKYFDLCFSRNIGTNNEEISEEQDEKLLLFKQFYNSLISSK